MRILRNTQSLPRAKLIYENSWEVNWRFVRDAINWTIGNNDNLTPREDIDFNHLYFLMDSYFQWVSKKLSFSRALNPKEVCQKLEKLGL